MITGHDSVYVAGGDPRVAIGRFLTAFRAEWPDMLIATADERFVPWRDAASSLPAQTGEVLVARDADMVDAWGQDGYFLGEHGGPFAIWYEPLKQQSLKVTALDDPYGRQGFRYQPYTLTLCSKALSLLTLVSPDAESAFSARLATAFSAALVE